MRMQSKAVLLTCILLVAMQRQTIDAQESRTGTISGRVTDCTGAPKGGAEVALAYLGDGKLLVAVSDTHGSFRFSGLAAGNYSLEVKFPGYLMFRRTGIRLPADGGLVTDATLAFDPLASMYYEVLRPVLDMDLPTLWRSVDAVVHLRIQEVLGSRRTPQADGPCENIYVEHRAAVLEVFRRLQAKPDAIGPVDFLQAAPAPGYSGMKTVTGNWRAFRAGDEMIAFLRWDDSEKAFLSYFAVPVKDGKVESYDLRETESAIRLDAFLKILRAMME